MLGVKNKNKIYITLIICFGIVVSVWLFQRKPNKIVSNQKEIISISTENYRNIPENTGNDWKKILVNMDPKNQTVTDLTKNNPDAFDPTSLTGQLAKDYFSQYLLAKKGGQAITPEVTDAIVQNVIANPEYTQTTSVVYLKSNLNISSNAETNTIKKYKSEMTKNVLWKIDSVKQTL